MHTQSPSLVQSTDILVQSLWLFSAKHINFTDQFVVRIMQSVCVCVCVCVCDSLDDICRIKWLLS